MSSNNSGILAGLKRVVVFGIFPFFMIPFAFLYYFGTWWLFSLLRGLPGGPFERHPNILLAVLAAVALFLFCITASTLWEKLRARFS